MPPVVLQILVDDSRGSPTIKVFNKSLDETTKALGHTSQAATQASKSTESFGSSIANSAKSAVGLAVGFAGIGGVVTTLSAAATAATGFEAALKAIDALGTVSTAQLSKLREQLLALPPALGSSTELAKGLYDILGANVPAENAITVLTQSAELAKAGLGTLDGAINAVTKSAAAFGIPLEQAQMIVDTMTQTVVRGQGRLEEFANAFPQVASTASIAGASFTDTSAAMAVLTQTFKNADTAATGLNSFFQQLIQNSSKFAAEGINVKEILSGPDGMSRLFEELARVTGGNAGKLKILINDSEGFRAATALTGAQLDTFNETVESYGNIVGLTQQSAAKNTSSTTATWATFINTLDRLVQEVAPPLLAMFTDLTRVLTVGAASVTKMWRAFQESAALTEITSSFSQLFAMLTTDTSLDKTKTSMEGVTESADKTYDALDVIDQFFRGNVVPALDFVAAGWDLLNMAMNETFASIAKGAQFIVDALVPLGHLANALNTLASAMGLTDGKFADAAATLQQLSRDLGEASDIFSQQAEEFLLGTHRMEDGQKKLKEETDKAAAATKNQAQALPAQAKASGDAATATNQLTEAQKAVKQAMDTANVSVSAFAGALEKLKIGDITKAIPTKDLEGTVAIITQSLEKMQASGQFTAREISKAYEDAAQIMRERFGELPAAFQASYDAMQVQARESADGITLAFERLGVETSAALQKTATAALTDFQTIMASGKAAPEQLLATWLDILTQIDQAGFKQLPENFQAVNQQMQDIARRAGVELPKPFVDAFGEIAIAAERAGEAGAKAATLIDTSWLQSRGALDRARGTVEELAESVVKLSDETQALMDLRISSETTFASDLTGLLKQLTQARKELQGIQSNVITAAGGAPGERDFFIKRQQEIIAALQAKLAALGYDELGRPLPGKTPATPGAPAAPAPSARPASPAPSAPRAPSAPPAILPRPSLDYTGALIRRQHGGPAWAGEPYLVGERGPELFVPRVSGTVLPAGQTQAAPSRSITYNLVIHTQATDAATLARDLVPYLRQADLSRRTLGG